jgi:hypothetical protein
VRAFSARHQRTDAVTALRNQLLWDSVSAPNTGTLTVVIPRLATDARNPSRLRLLVCAYDENGTRNSDANTWKLTRCFILE